MPLDPRVTPYRSDLAAAHLRGQVDAPRFVEGVAMQVRAGAAPLHKAPEPGSVLGSQILHGEMFVVYEQADGWCWGQLGTDGYVGYAPAAALVPEIVTATHRVRVPRSFLYPRPSHKSAPLDHFTLGTRVAVEAVEDGYARLATGGWLWAAHLGPLDEREPDLAATALRFLGVPYLWGGRSSVGFDCSGLAQTALACAGIAAPRDSSQQEGVVGEAVPDGAARRRNDLVYFPGHVGILQDPDTLVHATGHFMQVVVEPLDVVARRAGGITATRRVSGV